MFEPTLRLCLLIPTSGPRRADVRYVLTVFCLPLALPLGK